MSGFSLSAAGERIRRENLAHHDRCLARKAAARQEAERLARLLCETDSSITAVWGFGSTFAEDGFGEDSDVDLAVEGGDFDVVTKLVADSQFEIDLLWLEGNDGLCRQVRRRGVRLGGS